MTTLRPIYDYDKYSTPIAKAIYDALYAQIFAPLFAILESPDERMNASGLLSEAFRSGRLVYDGQYITGSFTAALSRQITGLGGVFNKTRRAYKIEPAALPQDVKFSIQSANETSRGKVDKVEKFLNDAQGKKMVMPNVDPQFGQIVEGLDKQFFATTKQVRAEDIGIPLDPGLQDELSAAYTKNLDMYIQDWHDHQILRLRQMVQENVAEGKRADALQETIMMERGVSDRKARFLARQETSLMVSKYRQIRYEQVGINKYIWSTSHDIRVRHDHKELNGKVFDFNHPPVTDRHTMARNNPGEDFNCRCVAIPVMTKREALEREYVGSES